MTLLDLPKGVAKLVSTLAQLEAQGYSAAEYATLAVMLDQHVRHVKASARIALKHGVLVVTGGGGRGKKATVQLTDAGRSLVAVPATSGARS